MVYVVAVPAALAAHVHFIGQHTSPQRAPGLRARMQRAPLLPAFLIRRMRAGSGYICPVLWGASRHYCTRTVGRFGFAGFLTLADHSLHCPARSQMRRR